jgi:signal transduction histidine kinase
VRSWFLSQKTNAMLADLSAYNMRRLDAVLDQARAARQRAAYAIMGLILAAALTSAAFAVYVGRGVLRPISLLTAASRNLLRPGAGQVPRLKDRNDELGTLSTSMADMTDRLTRANADLSAAVQSRDQFLSIAAHELRTPLTSLLMQCHLLAKRMPAEAQQQKLVANMDRQVRRLSDLVDELLDVSRIQAGKLEVKPEEKRVSEVVREVAMRLAPMLEAAASSLSLDLDDAVLCKLDPSRFDQMLVNLLGNAAKYAPGAPVTVRVREQDSWAVVTVQDEGPGIPPSLRSNLFERYTRHEKTSPSGLGLGLFIVRQMVEAHGGTIEVHCPERGTRFEMRFPGATREGANALRDVS